MLLPERIDDESHLEDLLSRPAAAAVEAMRRMPGDVLILGVGGKMGPSLARMIVRASEAAGVVRRVTAVSRFSSTGLERALRDAGIETIAGDLLDEPFVEGLPNAENVIFMAGMKFGTGDNPAATWAMNTYVPSLVCRRFAGRRMLAFSTGNVYPFVSIQSGGSVESDAPNPIGEYGMSALGRERTFEFFSRRDGTPVTILRLNYAVEMRYGVLADLAHKVFSGLPIDLSTGFANVIWQGDANTLALAALADASTPPFVINVAGAELLDVRQTCEQFSELMGRKVVFTGAPGETALLNNGQRAHMRYGAPEAPLRTLIEWTADWVTRGGVTWSKPTHFEARDGRF
ncbi:MAG: NAD-dependent epimerase/dehydratase family protein [Planctomycetaceae bacterium]|nr:NAD-dependent epimerase/dehydratase family protein [Planctomycetaceae bacterium]